MKEERQAGLEVIKHLQEIFRRKLYLTRGYASLFEMCMKEFKYSEPAAQRRIDAMRLMNQVPEVEEKIKAGTISLSVAARVQTFLKKEVKRKTEQGSGQNLNLDPMELPKEMTKEEKIELIESVEGKSCREVEKELVGRNPEMKIAPDRVKFVTTEKVEMKVTLSKELMAKLEKVKGLLSHKTGNAWEAVFDEMAEIALRKLEPAVKNSKSQVRKRKTKQKTSLPPQSESLNHPENQVIDLSRDRSDEIPPARQAKTRYIRKSVKTQVWKRDHGCCSYIDPKTQRRCGAKSFIQFDHIQSFALGGGNTTENLRLLCAAHNRNRNERSYLT